MQLADCNHRSKPKSVAVKSTNKEIYVFAKNKKRRIRKNFFFAVYEYFFNSFQNLFIRVCLCLRIINVRCVLILHLNLINQLDKIRLATFEYKFSVIFCVKTSISPTTAFQLFWFQKHCIWNNSISYLILRYYIWYSDQIFEFFLDIDECAEGTHQCKGGNIECINIPSGYNCKCKAGYVGDQRRGCKGYKIYSAL